MNINIFSTRCFKHEFYMNFFRNPLSNITNSTILLCGIIIVFRYVREVLSCISAFRV